MSEAEFKLGPLTFDGDDAWYLRDQQGSAIMSDEQYYPWVPSEEIYWRLFAAAPDMLALLKEYVAEDPCAAGDPRGRNSGRDHRHPRGAHVAGLPGGSVVVTLGSGNQGPGTPRLIA